MSTFWTSLAAAVFTMCAVVLSTPSPTLKPWTYSDQRAWPPDCDGHRQSPIDFRESKPARLNGTFKLDFLGRCTFSAQARGDIIPSHHAFALTDPAMSCQIVHPGTRRVYNVAELHFHTPAEHVLPSGVQPLELHVVSVLPRDPTQKLVLAVQYRIGDDSNAVTTALLTAMFQQATFPSTETWSIIDLLPPLTGGTIGTLLTYSGSLTTPPCTESVSWVVVGQTAVVSRRIVSLLNALMQAKAGEPFTNNRHVQPISAAHDVKLLNNGAFENGSFAETSHVGRKTAIVLAGALVFSAIGFLLWVNRASLGDGEDPEAAASNDETARIVSSLKPGYGTTV